jgi:hypothetical protein
MILSIGEIFQKIQECKTFEEKKQILLKHNTPALRTYLRIAFDGNVRMLLPEGLPKIKLINVPQGLGETSLLSEAKKMYIFLEVDGQPAHPSINVPKRETKFLGLLQAFDNVEREYFKQLKDKSLDLGLSFDEINSILPGLLSKENENAKKLGNDSENTSSTDDSSESDSGENKETHPTTNNDTPQKEKKPKRKRRTKAQIAAEKEKSNS